MPVVMLQFVYLCASVCADDDQSTIAPTPTRAIRRLLFSARIQLP